MHSRQTISVGNLLLDVKNYRNNPHTNQKDERDSIILEQGRKLVVLAQDIINYGLSPIDNTLVIDANDGNHNFIVIEGNRRLTTLQLLLNPELAEGTEVYGAFKKLNRNHADSIPKVVDCVIVPNKKAGLVWINRKHASGLEGAGTDPWNAIAKARADADQGIPRPDLDALNFVLTNPNLDSSLRKTLDGSTFNITSLQRVIETKEVQQAVGYSIQNGQLITDQVKERVQGILTEVVTVIATGKKSNGDKFTVRDIDSTTDREDFIKSVVANHASKKKAPEVWTISGKPTKATLKTKSKTRSTPSTAEQINLIPRKFKLELPSGKINDIFDELKGLDATTRRHAVSVLFRVFFELTLNDYIQKHKIDLPLDQKGNVVDKLSVRLERVKDHVKATKLLTDKEMKPIDVAIGDKHSFLSAETLNAYVHSEWMNPDPLALKLTWANVQLFVERLWNSKK